MPEIKKVFLRGKMNKDLDERLIPDGEYRDASNIQISSTESSDAGTVQNILGNEKISNLGIGGSCVGSIENTETDKIYLFIKGTSVNAIVEYNESTNVFRPVLIDNRSSKILNFIGNKITGITIIQNFLVFTDNESEPKILDVSDASPFITGSIDYNTTTRINNQPFIESDISLIKKKPHNAPKIKFDYNGSGAVNSNPRYKEKFVRFAYRWKFTNGQYSALSPFSEPAFLPSTATNYDLSEGVNNQMLNNITGAFLYNMECGNGANGADTINNIEYLDILYKESNNTNIYLYSSITKSEALSAYSSGYSVYNEVKKSILPENQLLRAYDNVPFKAKAVDIVGNRIVFGNYKDGLDVEGFVPSFQQADVVARTYIEDEEVRKVFNAQGNLISGAQNLTNNSVPDMAAIKGGRTYEIGIVFEDEYGRQTPVVTGSGAQNEGTLEIPHNTGDEFGSKFKIQMAGTPPSGNNRITRFKYYIKPSSNKFYNIAVKDIKNDLEDSSTVWLVVPSYEIDKVKEGQILQLKKALNTSAIINYNNQPNNFKFKILDISSETPENIDATESFDGKFFIKIKKTAQITENIIQNAGSTGGNNTVINTFIQVDVVPSNALFLGQVEEPNEDRYYSYYFKDGEIYEVPRRIPSGVTITPTFTTANALQFIQTIGGQYGYADLTQANGLTGFRPTGATYTDTTGTTNATVNSVSVKVASGDFPSSFHIGYSSLNQDSNSANIIPNSSPAVFETMPEDEVLDVFYETSESFPITAWGSIQYLNWHNCYKLGNGVESSTIRDDFNEDTIDPGVKVSTQILQEYTERTQQSSLIYSGIFNSETNINNLNQFNTALKITKELNPEYGSIQKLHARNTDLIALCEDKVLKVLANKDALFNADGNVNLTATENVLGQAIAYNGEYGISRNPESFASYGYRAYFTDKARGAVIRLSRDGLTVISDKGMTSFFRENLLDESNDIVGSYDIYSDQYILTLPSINSSISFKEDVDGWVSRLSFVPEEGVSLNGNYYTCKNGEIYLHHFDGSQRNTFYGIFGKSGIQLIFNQEPSAIKNFKTISYEGTENWITDLTGTDIIRTDQQEGEIIEFKEKEGKYYGLISGIETQLDSISSTELNTRLKDFSIQGLGNISSTSGANIFTCNDAGFSIINGSTGESSLTKSSVSLGTLISVSPSTLQSGSAQYTASIRVPNGYTNTGATITCTDNATGTDTDIEFTPAVANLQINDGTVGDTVTGTVDAGTIASISPSVYSQGTATYTATINIPASGYTNSGTITATDTATGGFGSCGFSLSVGAYSSGGTTLTGSFTGTDFGSNPTINLTVDSGTISPTSTTKSALTSGLAITVNQAANITATIASGLCSQEPATATIQAPQASTVAISGIGTEYVYQSITLTANVTGSVSSYQWYKDTNSGFTPSSSNIINGATSATLSTTETTADTIYYKVKIDGTTDSADHIVIWTAYTAHTNLKYLAGSSANNLACTSTTLRTIYSNGTFTGAANFYVNPQGSSSGFAAGTYSDGTNYRFINSGGIPSSSIGCSSPGGQQIQASSCRNSNDIHYFDVDLNGNNSLSNGNVISFTSQVEGNTYWVVDNSNYTGSSFDATPTLSSTHSSCLVADPPTLDLSASPEVFVNANVSLNAQPQFTPQGATFTYVYQKSTDGGSSFSTIQTTTNANITDTAPSSATTNLRYKVSIQGTSIESGVKTTNVSAYHAHTLQYAATGSNNNSACTSGSTQNVFANINYIAGTITQLYTSATGSTSGFAAGTYSDGNIHGYFNSSGQLQGSWVQCPAPASGSVEIQHNGSASNVTGANPFATVTLNAITSNISNITGYQWTENSSNVDTNSSYGASLTTTEINNIGLGSVTKTYGVTVSGDGTTFNDTITVTWQGVSQTVAVIPCVGSGTKYARITNSSGWPVNTVLNFTGGGGTIPDGCYKIINNNYGGSYDASVTVSGGYPFSFTTSCCTCSGCSASISGSSTGTQGTGETLTANATGITPSGYTWFVSYTHPTNGPWTEITSQTSQTSLWNVSSAGTVYYKVTISGYNASDSNATLDAYHTITWSASQTPVARTYQLRELDSTTCGISDAIAYGNYTSINALNSNTVVTLQGNTTQCYSVVGYISSYNSSYSAINAEYPSCTNCYSIINQDCSFTLNAGSTYNNSNGTALFTANIGTSANSTDTISLAATDGSTVSPTSTTVGALESGLNVTIGQGKTLRATITSGTCNNTSQTAQAPSLNCQSVTLYYSTNNPASNAAAKTDLCGLGNTRSFRLNAGSLSLATQLYTDSSCSTLESGTKYFSQNNIEYYVWNGSSFSNGTPLNCSGGGNIQ